MGSISATCVRLLPGVRLRARGVESAAHRVPTAHQVERAPARVASEHVQHHDCRYEHGLVRGTYMYKYKRG
jgi:hypothetical protein